MQIILRRSKYEIPLDICKAMQTDRGIWSLDMHTKKNKFQFHWYANFFLSIVLYKNSKEIQSLRILRAVLSLGVCLPEWLAATYNRNHKRFVNHFEFLRLTEKPPLSFADLFENVRFIGIDHWSFIFLSSLVIDRVSK